MTVKTVLLLILGGVVANNYALEKFLGLTPLLGFSGRDQKRLGLGLAVTLVTVLSAALLWPLQHLVLEPLALGYLQTLVYVAVVLIVLAVLDLIFRRDSKPFGLWFPLLALNSAVLGAAVLNTAAGSFWECLFGALGAGLGFLLALYLLAGLRSRIEDDAVPKAFRGLPVELLAAAILAMTLVAFK